MAAVRVPMSLMRLILLRCSACPAFSFARFISAFFSPRLATRMVTTAPRSPLNHDSSSARRAGSTGTMTSRGTGAIGASRSARPVCSCRSRLVRVACARSTLLLAVTVCVLPMASRLSTMEAPPSTVGTPSFPEDEAMEGAVPS